VALPIITASHALRSPRPASLPIGFIGSEAKGTLSQLAVLVRDTPWPRGAVNGAPFGVKYRVPRGGLG
jgi:hypothetical protein